MRVAVVVATALHPELSLRLALRALGRSTYRTFLTSLTGRIVFGVLGGDINKLIAATTKAYGITQSHGRATVIEASNPPGVLEYRDLVQFLDAFEIGVVEEAVASCGLTPLIEVQLATPSAHRLKARYCILRYPW